MQPIKVQQPMQSRMVPVHSMSAAAGAPHHAFLPSRASIAPRAFPSAQYHPGRTPSTPKVFSQVSGNAVKEEQLRKMTEDPGFISALDESGGTSPKTLAAFGVTADDYKDDAEMMSMVHDLRAKIMMNPTYKEGSIIGAILFEDTINRDVEGIPTTQS